MPSIPFDSVRNPLRLPHKVYLGEASGVPVHSMQGPRAAEVDFIAVHPCQGSIHHIWKNPSRSR